MWFAILEMDPNNHSPPPNSSVSSPSNGGTNGLHIGHNNNNNNPDTRIRMSPSNNTTNESGQDLTSRGENVGYHNF